MLEQLSEVCDVLQHLSRSSPDGPCWRGTECADKGVPAKVVALIMGHTKVDTTMNVYTQVLDGAARTAADRVGSELFRIVQNPERAAALTH